MISMPWSGSFAQFFRTKAAKSPESPETVTRSAHFRPFFRTKASRLFHRYHVLGEACHGTLGVIADFEVHDQAVAALCIFRNSE